MYIVTYGMWSEPKRFDSFHEAVKECKKQSKKGYHSKVTKNGKTLFKS